MSARDVSDLAPGEPHDEDCWCPACLDAAPIDPETGLVDIPLVLMPPEDEIGTADLFPTVEEVGAKAIEMYRNDPNWWRHTFPIELAGIIDRWCAAHDVPLPTRLPADTRVRVRTTNGGDAIAVLKTEYVPGYGCDFHHVRDDGTVHPHYYHRLGTDIISVDVVP